MRSAVRMHRKAFTLVELLLAGLLLTIVAGSLVAALSMGVRIYGAAERESAARLNILLAMEVLRKDLRQAWPSARIPLKGQSDSLALPVLCRLSLGGEDPSPIPCRAEYVLDAAKNRIRRVVWPAGTAEESATLRQENWCPGVEGLRFRYGTRVIGDRAPVWRSHWPASGNLPDVVEIQVLWHEGASSCFLREVVSLPRGE